MYVTDKLMQGVQPTSRRCLQAWLSATAADELVNDSQLLIGLHAPWSVACHETAMADAGTAWVDSACLLEIY